MIKKLKSISNGIKILFNFFKSKAMKDNFHLMPLLIILFIFAIVGILVISSGGVSPLLYPLF